MRHHLVILAALSLVLTGCGGEAPTAQPSTTVPPPTTSTTPSAQPTTTTPTAALPSTPPTSDVQDCFDADCTLLLTGPTTIPLDGTTFHYPAMAVTAFSTTNLSYSVTYPGSGGAESTIGVGVNGSSFGFRGSPSVRVGLLLIDGTPALVLHPGPIS